MFFDGPIHPGDVVAVGDIHARYDLFEKFLDFVQDSFCTVVLLGDIIDRGGDDLKVLNKVLDLMLQPEDEGLANFFCLMGNHEEMFVDAVNGTGAEFLLWLQNGGNFEDYAEMQEHVEWLQELPIYMTLGETLFVHAGIFPGQDPLETIKKGKASNLLWMREPFLSQGPQFEKWSPTLKKVVFGHTPNELSKPYEIPQGVCIDTGAYYSGVLTAYNVTQGTFFEFTGSTNAKATATY